MECFNIKYGLSIEKSIDITDEVMKECFRGTILFINKNISFNNFKGDPYVNIIKKLFINVTYDNKIKKFEFNEYRNGDIYININFLHNKHNNNELFYNKHNNNGVYTNNINDIELFHNKNNDAIITFIIPTINRLTLVRSLLSLLNQDIQNWKAIIVFDGCEPEPKIDHYLSKLLLNSRFLYICINKLGKLYKHGHNSAGYVRNVGMNLVRTKWVGFLDDDDFLLPDYTQKLIKEIKINRFADLILFRMSKNNEVIPSLDNNTISLGNIGISYSFKIELFNIGFKFSQSQQEDFDLIKDIELSNKKIVISKYVTYLVRGSKQQSVF